MILEDIKVIKIPCEGKFSRVSNTQQFFYMLMCWNVSRIHYNEDLHNYIWLLFIQNRHDSYLFGDSHEIFYEDEWDGNGLLGIIVLTIWAEKFIESFHTCELLLFGFLLEIELQS